MPTPPAPRILVELARRAAQATPEQRGALWRLEEPGRQLDANLVRLAPGGSVAEHAEDSLDVVLVVVEGSGRIDGPGGSLPLDPHALVWLPRTSRRSLTAGPQGLAYLTVHQRRAALGITNRAAQPLSSPAAEGGEGPCLLNRVCDGCGRISPELSARYCARCGDPLPTS